MFKGLMAHETDLMANEPGSEPHGNRVGEKPELIGLKVLLDLLGGCQSHSHSDYAIATVLSIIRIIIRLGCSEIHHHPSGSQRGA